MLDLQRNMNHKWIIDKNVNSKSILSDFAILLNNNFQNQGFKFDDLISHTITQGRNGNRTGSPITIGVRLLQTCFYMFGYSKNIESAENKKIFMPSPMLLNIIATQDEEEKRKNFLVNLFCMQYPHPFDWTPECFNLFFGRLILKLLLDSRLDYKLYIDECIWFLPFIETIDSNTYEELVASILEYRQLSYKKKICLFQSVEDYEKLFANVLHEINYYFLRLFNDFGVFDLIGDETHNEGNLFRFLHSKSANTTTYRNDAYLSRKQYSGYVQLNASLVPSAQLLLEKYSAFDQPSHIDGEEIFTREDWLTNLYQTEPLRYLAAINTKIDPHSDIMNIVNEMIRTSKFGSRDGKEFEKALKPFIELFKENVNVEILSGAGKTDLLCTMIRYPDYVHYNMNVDAKTRQTSLEGINSARIMKHLRQTSAAFCIVVAPKFARGVSGDIGGQKIVAIRAEEFGNYCYKECINSADNLANFSPLLKIINENLGTDITSKIRTLTEEKYGTIVKDPVVMQGA